MRVSLTTFGCRLNQAETDAMQAGLERSGWTVVDQTGDADVVVLNSCTITHRADADLRRAVRRARRVAPDARIVVTGCYANAQPDAVAGLPGVDLVLGNGDKGALPGRLQELRGGPPSGGDAPDVVVSSLVRRKTLEPLRAAMPRGRVRALLKIQDGCNYRCAFCIVPSVRGPSRSLGIDDIREQLETLVEQGVPEIVLTGIHLGTWGRDLRPRRRLAELVHALLPSLGPARLRLSSIDPHEVDDDLIVLMVEHPGRICRHLHLPVQAGDPDVLRRMRRGHTVEDFVRLCTTLAQRIEGIALGTDVIVGFPGEDEAAFERTVALLSELPVAYHHVFPYSERDGTPAASFAGSVEPVERRRRCDVLRRLSDEQLGRFRRAFDGRSVDAVVEYPRGGHTRVLTDNYLRVKLRGNARDPQPRPGQRGSVRLMDEGRWAQWTGEA